MNLKQDLKEDLEVFSRLLTTTQEEKVELTKLYTFSAYSYILTLVLLALTELVCMSISAMLNSQILFLVILALWVFTLCHVVDTMTSLHTTHKKIKENNESLIISLTCLNYWIASLEDN